MHCEISSSENARPVTWLNSPILWWKSLLDGARPAAHALFLLRALLKLAPLFGNAADFSGEIHAGPKHTMFCHITVFNASLQLLQERGIH